MRGKHVGQHKERRLLARGGVALLAAVSIGFAAPAVGAQPDNKPGAPSAQGSAHQQATAHATTHTSTQPTKHTAKHTGRHLGSTSSPASSQSGSAVSLAKPNDFQAQSDPDGMANGGVDQPGGTGGIDQTSQDGNNGSGNDADCEDDNRGVGVPGHCKDRPGTGNEAGTTLPDQTPDQTPEQNPVLATDLTPQLLLVPSLTPAVDTGTASSLVSAPASSQVRGQVRTQAAHAAPVAGVLPETGAGQALLGLALAALVALGLGGGLVRRGRRRVSVAG